MKFRPYSMLPMLPLVALTAPAADPSFVPKEIAAYPFMASATRAAAIKDKSQLVVVGMTPAEVTAILGEPDEVRPLYAPMVKNSQQTGHSYWYVIRRMVANGSVNDKREAAVRISFDLQGRVTNVAHWDLEENTPPTKSTDGSR